MINHVALGALLCLMYTTSFAQPEVSSSFHNLSKPQGGPVSTGDILEIRAVISIPQSTDITRLRFVDFIPAGTSYIPNSMKAMTNEGVFGSAIDNTGSYSDAAGDDRGTLVAGNGIRINLGDAAGSGIADTDGGHVTGGITIPRFQTQATIVQAAFAVLVTATANQSITLAGEFHYRNSSAADVIVQVPGRIITILPQLGCTGQGFTNLITAENGGTFSQGTSHDRGASANTFDFNYTPVGMWSPNDGAYSITKNSSPTEYTGNTPAITDQVFGIWDIAGDHTGTYDGLGNPPSANGATGGYMLLVNASYAPNSIFTTTVTGLIPNTTYTLSFWLRNICSMCGYDPVTGNAAYSAGVKPNLAFAINGEDLYTTGDLTYSGEWVEKSFTFNSGALNSANITIKNNAPGGGGNDWVLDDISITSCIVLLPVALEAFDAETLPAGVLLQWRTGNEQMTGQFHVEYSTDGRNFESAAVLNATGSNSSYSFIHNRKSTARTYYRLKQVEPSGKFSYSRVLVIQPREESTFIRLLSASGTTLPVFSIYSAQPDKADVRVVDAGGKLHSVFQVKLPAGNSTFTLPRQNNFSPGVYFVQVKTTERSQVLQFLVR